MMTGQISYSCLVLSVFLYKYLFFFSYIYRSISICFYIHLSIYLIICLFEHLDLMGYKGLRHSIGLSL